MRSRKKSISMVLFAFITLFMVQSTLIASAAVTIKKINNQTVTLNYGAYYKLPSTVSAILSDSTTKLMAVKWNVKSINTRAAGTQNYLGTVSGYKAKVKLTITIKKQAPAANNAAGTTPTPAPSSTTVPTNNAAGNNTTPIDATSGATKK